MSPRAHEVAATEGFGAVEFLFPGEAYSSTGQGSTQDRKPITLAANMPGTNSTDSGTFARNSSRTARRRYVHDQMGHSSIKVTFDTYGHLFPPGREESSRYEKAM